MDTETRKAITELEIFFNVIENDKKPRHERTVWEPKSLEAKKIREINEIKAWMSWKGRTYGNT